MRWDDEAWWPKKFVLDGREFTYPEAGKAFRINPGVLLHRVEGGLSGVDAIAHAPQDPVTTGTSVGFLRVVQVQQRGSLGRARVMVRCSRCGHQYQTTWMTLRNSAASLHRRSGCSRCYKSSILVRSGEQLLTLMDVADHVNASKGLVYARLKKLGIDTRAPSTVDIGIFEGNLRVGVHEDRRRCKVGDALGPYRVEGFVAGGGYKVVCEHGHRKIVEYSQRLGQCGQCLGRGAYDTVIMGGKSFSVEALARIVGKTVRRVKLLLRRGDTPEQILIYR